MARGEVIAVNEHAYFAPSSMYLTVACPGWLRTLEQSGLPSEPETEATREGELAHYVAARAAAGQTFSAGSDGVTEEMLDGAATWVSALEGYSARIETPVQITRVHPTKCWGTPDARQHNAERKIVRLADYKFGHEYVDEFENWQMLAYSVGVADELGVFDDMSYSYEMTVVQPRYYGAEPVRTWTIQGAGLKHYAERMKEAVRLAESAEPPVRSGTHCTHCPARTACATFRKTVGHAIDYAGRPEVMLSTPEQIGAELVLVQEFIKRLEARETGLSAVAEALIRGGARVPNYSLEQSVGRLAWTVPLEVVELSAKMVGKSALQPPKLVTPTQAKDRKLLDSRIIAAYSDRPTGAMRLTRNTKAERKFKT
jgi:hypothetical protein